MTRNQWNKLVTVVMGLLVLCLIATGGIMHFVLSTEGHHGRGAELSADVGDEVSMRARVGEPPQDPGPFLGVDREGWGEVHLTIAIIFVAMVVLHLVLNWPWIRHNFVKAHVAKTKSQPNA